MGLFSRKKSSTPDMSADFSNMSSPGLTSPNMQSYNSGLTASQYSDPLMDPNSGLKLHELNANSQDMNFGQNATMDSFGNAKPAQRVENFEYKSPQQYAPPDNSKDLQIIIAKLDAIRSEITNINHRLDNIERQQKEAPPKKYPW